MTVQAVGMYRRRAVTAIPDQGTGVEDQHAEMVLNRGSTHTAALMF